MPFKSEAQRRWMFAKHPAMAERWAEETPAGKLPEKVKKAYLRVLRPTQYPEHVKQAAAEVVLKVLKIPRKFWLLAVPGLGYGAVKTLGGISSDDIDPNLYRTGRSFAPLPDKLRPKELE